MQMANLKISTKIAAAFAILVVIAACMGALLFQSMVKIETAAEDKNNQVALSNAAIDARFALARQENSLLGFMITRDAYFSGRVKEHYATFQKNVAYLGEVAGAGSPIGSSAMGWSGSHRVSPATSSISPPTATMSPVLAWESSRSSCAETRDMSPNTTVRWSLGT